MNLSNKIAVSGDDSLDPEPTPLASLAMMSLSRDPIISFIFEIRAAVFCECHRQQ
jgi:hypothetical protein